LSFREVGSTEPIHDLDYSAEILDDLPSLAECTARRNKYHNKSDRSEVRDSPLVMLNINHRNPSRWRCLIASFEIRILGNHLSSSVLLTMCHLPNVDIGLFYSILQSK
jgi:hypothetical protein